MNVMLLAAGEGTRLRPFTYKLPKPAIPFLNIPLASHSLGFLGDLEIDKLVVNTFHLPEKVHSLFHTIPHRAKELHFSDEVGEILGNGGGLGKARDHFLGHGDFIMMNSDEVILPRDPNILQKAIAQHKASGAIATLLVMEHHGVGSQFGGVWTTSQNQVKGFGKEPVPGTHKAWHFIGVQILSEKIFQYIPNDGASNILYDVVIAAINNHELVQCFPFEATWFETGNPKDFLEAADKCLGYLFDPQESFEKTSLQKVFNRYASSNIKLQKTHKACLCYAESAHIDNSAELSGFIFCSEGSVIPKNCSLQNVVVGENVRVPEGTRAENTLLI